MTIVKEGSGWVVYSSKGKKMSKPFKSKTEAEHRLQQIEYFKHKDRAKRMYPSMKK